MKLSVEYTVVTSESPTQLSTMVNELFADGWMVHGGLSTQVAVIQRERPRVSKVVYHYAQAMIRDTRINMSKHTVPSNGKVDLYLNGSG